MSLLKSSMVFSTSFLEHPPRGWHVAQTTEATYVWRTKRGRFKLTGKTENVGGELIWEAEPVA